MLLSAAMHIAQAVPSVPPLVAAAAITAGSSLVGGIANALSNNRQAELMEQVLADRRAFTERVQRIGRGEFTPFERRNIDTANQPMLNRLAQSAAARGVRGGAREEILARARQAPFLAQQQAALGVESQSLSAEQSLIPLAPGDPDLAPLFSGLQSLAASYSQLQGQNQGATQAGQGFSADPVLEEAIDIIYNDSQGLFNEGVGVDQQFTV